MNASNGPLSDWNPLIIKPIRFDKWLPI